jgi:hypothetical protein
MTAPGAELFAPDGVLDQPLGYPRGDVKKELAVAHETLSSYGTTVQ